MCWTPPKSGKFPGFEQGASLCQCRPLKAARTVNWLATNDLNPFTAANARQRVAALREAQTEMLKSLAGPNRYALAVNGFKSFFASQFAYRAALRDRHWQRLASGSNSGNLPGFGGVQNNTKNWEIPNHSWDEWRPLWYRGYTTIFRGGRIYSMFEAEYRSACAAGEAQPDADVGAC